MRVVIMADGKGTRWKKYLGVPKHLAMIDGEKLIGRTIRLLRKLDSNNELEIIVTSHDKRYEFEGSRRYEPINNNLEIDRFTEELIEDNMCFLYGDTYYTASTLNTILKKSTCNVDFFGNSKSIVGIKIKDSDMFKKHVSRVKNMYLEGKIEKCIGWQVYQSFTGQVVGNEVIDKNGLIFVDEKTVDINTPNEYEEIVL